MVVHIGIQLYQIWQGVQRTFQQMDFKQLYIFEVNLVEFNSNIFWSYLLVFHTSLDFLFYK